MDYFSCSTMFLLIYSFYKKKTLAEVPEYAKMQFHMMSLLDVLGKIACVRLDFSIPG